MTITAIEPSAQVAPRSEDALDDGGGMLRNAADILSQIEDFITEIDHAASLLSDAADELRVLDGLPEEAEDFASDLCGVDLTRELIRTVRVLRGVLARADDDRE